MRTSGYGKAAILPLKPKKIKKSKNKTLTPKDGSDNSDSEDPNTGSTSIQFKLSSIEAKKLEREFQEVIEKLKVQFPIKKMEKLSENTKND